MKDVRAASDQEDDNPSEESSRISVTRLKRSRTSAQDSAEENRLKNSPIIKLLREKGLDIPPKEETKQRPYDRVPGKKPVSNGRNLKLDYSDGALNQDRLHEMFEDERLHGQITAHPEAENQADYIGTMVAFVPRGTWGHTEDNTIE